MVIFDQSFIFFDMRSHPSNKIPHNLHKTILSRCTSNCFLSFGLAILLMLPSLTLASEHNIPALSKKEEQKLLAISSDQKAISFYQQTFRLPPQRTRSHRPQVQETLRSRPSTKVQTKIITFIGNLLASTMAKTIQTHLQHQNKNDTRHLLDTHSKTIEWMLSQPSLPSSAKNMVTFHSHLHSYFDWDLTSPQRPDSFDAFATYVDQHYPLLIGSPDSWVSLLEQGKHEELAQRLGEYWEIQSSQESFDNQRLQQVRHQELQTSYARYYSLTRLWPIFKAHLLSLTIQAKTETLLAAKQTLRTIQDEQRTTTSRHAKVRLCGKWQWTVHNHQNHGDHKLIMYFGDSKDSPPSQPQPSEIQVHGNAVYLLWKFPKGFQEDSLLLSNNDGRLEGTFRNTFGPYGSITGKRLSSCKR